ncbi:MAG: SH3 domain-containing protein [Gammaproteobacteria bacterium]|nr:SH3 domain-containing protein [Gammaproteobacteria bacterium]
MSRRLVRLAILLLIPLPLTGVAAPPPYWSGYPPTPYYYPYPPMVPAAEAAAPLPADIAPPEPEPAPEAGADHHEIPPTNRLETDATTRAETEQPATEVDAITTPSREEGAAVRVDALQSGADTDGQPPQPPAQRAPWIAEIASAIQQGNFAEAYYLWRPRAEEGDANAQYGIGWMYHNGYGLAINDEKASDWWGRASSQGHIDATFALGMLYGLGEGAVRRDTALAVHYYHRAARDGHEDARLLLRTLIAEGDGAALKLMQELISEGRQQEITSPAAVQSAKANVRRGPGTDHPVVTTLEQGAVLLPLRRKGRWLLVGLQGKSRTGWIHDSLVGREILTTP